MHTRALRDAPRWIFLATLIYAPWAYGCTTEATIIGLNWFLGTALALWAVDRAVLIFTEKTGLSGSRSGRSPVLAVPLLLVITCAVLLGIGWWMVLNASAVYDSAYSLFIPLKKWFSWGSGSVDQTISAAWMVRATTLLGVSLFVADLSQRPAWLVRLWWTVAIAGGSIALLGLLQKASGAEMIFWQPELKWEGKNFFATYYYHANAGAFLNLVLPPALGVAIRGFMKPRAPLTRATGLAVAVLLMIAVFSNTSRAAQLLAACLIVALAAGPGRRALRHAWSANRRLTVLGALVGIVAIWAIAQASQLNKPLARWQLLPEQLPRDERWQASEIALGAVRDVGCLGYGPGTFRVVFPHYLKQAGLKDEGVWYFLHQDYLQTVLEWGWIGAALWSVYFFGGIVVAIRNLRTRATAWMPRYRVLLPLAVLALAGVAIHALVDFPLQIASIQLYVATYLGICWGSCLWKGRASVVPAVPPQDINPEARPPALAT
jgi:hypothetical protein